MVPVLGRIIHTYSFITRLLSVADPHHFDPDPDLAVHFDADPNPDPACHFYPDPDLTFHFDANADPDPSLQIKAQNLKKSAQIGSYSLFCGLSSAN